MKISSNQGCGFISHFSLVCCYILTGQDTVDRTSKIIRSAAESIVCISGYYNCRKDVEREMAPIRTFQIINRELLWTHNIHGLLMTEGDQVEGPEYVCPCLSLLSRESTWHIRFAENGSSKSDLLEVNLGYYERCTSYLRSVHSWKAISALQPKMRQLLWNILDRFRIWFVVAESSLRTLLITYVYNKRV